MNPAPAGWKLVTQMSLFKDPLIVAARRHNGWKELITRVRVDAGTGYYAELQYDGQHLSHQPQRGAGLSPAPPRTRHRLPGVERQGSPLPMPSPVRVSPRNEGL